MFFPLYGIVRPEGQFVGAKVKSDRRNKCIVLNQYSWDGLRAINTFVYSTNQPYAKAHAANQGERPGEMRSSA
jgi:hypothetical protein